MKYFKLYVLSNRIAGTFTFKKTYFDLFWKHYFIALTREWSFEKYFKKFFTFFAERASNFRLTFTSCYSHIFFTLVKWWPWQDRFSWLWQLHLKGTHFHSYPIKKTYIVEFFFLSLTCRLGNCFFSWMTTFEYIFVKKILFIDNIYPVLNVLVIKN
jgi:hypothetical protein